MLQNTKECCPRTQLTTWKTRHTCDSESVQVQLANDLREKTEQSSFAANILLNCRWSKWRFWRHNVPALLPLSGTSILILESRRCDLFRATKKQVELILLDLTGSTRHRGTAMGDSHPVPLKIPCTAVKFVFALTQFCLACPLNNCDLIGGSELPNCIVQTSAKLVQVWTDILLSPSRVRWQSLDPCLRVFRRTMSWNGYKSRSSTTQSHKSPPSTQSVYCLLNIVKPVLSPLIQDVCQGDLWPRYDTGLWATLPWPTGFGWVQHKTQAQLVIVLNKKQCRDVPT